jgi:uncharacterized protein YkwD
MLSATLAVAAVASGVLFAGFRGFGSADAAGFDGRVSIGAPAEINLQGHAAPVRSEAPQAPSSSAPAPLTAAQPGLPSSAPPSPVPSKTTAKPKAVVTTVTANGSAEDQVLSLVNVERAKAGCSAVTADAKLTAAARGHSSDMAVNNYFSHDTQQGVSFATRITNAGYTWSSAGENIAWGQGTAAAVMKDWMNSSGHRANILNCGFKNLGVGLAYDSKRRPYWTQDFASPR